MKKNIHPSYQELKIKIGSDQFTTCSTLQTGEILMDVDYRKHPAWNSSSNNFINQTNKNLSDFNKKFGNISFRVKT